MASPTRTPRTRASAYRPCPVSSPDAPPHFPASASAGAVSRIPVTSRTLQRPHRLWVLLYNPLRPPPPVPWRPPGTVSLSLPSRHLYPPCPLPPVPPIHSWSPHRPPLETAPPAPPPPPAEGSCHHRLRTYRLHPDRPLRRLPRHRRRSSASIYLRNRSWYRDERTSTSTPHPPLALLPP